MKSILRIGFSFAALLLMAVALATPFGISAMSLAGAGTAVAGGSLMVKQSGVAFAGLNKEIWLPELMEGFYADDGIMSAFTDLSAFVDNDKINLAEAGVDPEVLLNNTGTVGYTQRTDIPIALELETLDTVNTLIKSIEKAELSYDKRTSLIKGHTNSLRMFFLERAMQNVAPAADGNFTPLLVTTGPDDGTGRKRMLWADLRRLQRRFNNTETPPEERYIIISETHQEDLEIEDVDRFNRVMDKGMVCGFKIHNLADKRLPRYNKTTGAKVAFKAVAAPSTDAVATVAWQKGEVMKSLGSADMFGKEKDPELRGDMFGFQQRALSMPIRNKGIAAIYSPAA